MVEMKKYDIFAAKEINSLIEQFFKHLDDIWKITDIKQLKYYLFQLEFSLRSLETQSQQSLKLALKAILDKYDNNRKTSFSRFF